MTKLILYFSTLISFYGCLSKNKEELKDYYYPIDNLDHEKIYTYIVDNSVSVDTLFWRFKKLNFEDNEVLSSKSYTSEGLVTENLAIYSENAAINLKSTIYLYDIEKNQYKIETRVDNQENILFPFTTNNSTNAALRFAYIDPQNKSYTTIEKIRKFEKFTKVEFGDSIYDCALFSGKIIYTNNNNSVEYSTSEVYAKYIGLIKSTKISNGIKRETILVEIR